MLMIVGLGNPGKQYENTRHNVGFQALDRISEEYGFTWQKKEKFNAEIAVNTINNVKIILCKPQTYMNLSGNAVQLVAAYYKIKLQDIIVIHDEIDLPCGKIKCKSGGGHAGHNGLRSLDQMLTNNNYFRMRIGVGRPPNQHMDVSDYVLTNFTNDELNIITNKINLITENIPLLASGQLNQLQNNLT
ncbi:MAG: aminoacyl-tRNA hydrolase [Rickettsiaceae bacterium]|nr:aminoacyl-tRNA hydrolase [Rickettsiaceae bacterium]